MSHLLYSIYTANEVHVPFPLGFALQVLGNMDAERKAVHGL